MSAAEVAQQHFEQQAVEFEGTVPGQQVQYVMQAPAVQGVVYAQAPQPVAYVGAQPAQYTYLAPPEGQVTYLNAPAGEAGQQVVYLQGQDGQQVHVQGQEVDGALSRPAEQFTYTAPEDGEIARLGAEAQQVAYYEAPVIAAAPARVNVSHDIFAKLAAGVQLTPEEMAQLSGQPAGPAVPGSPQAAGAAVPGSPGNAKASEKKEKKEKKDKSGEKALKASKKKEKGCC